VCAQQKISSKSYLALLMLGVPICIYLPTYFFLGAVMPRVMATDIGH
jgi:hypothetical protein